MEDFSILPDESSLYNESNFNGSVKAVNTKLAAIRFCARIFKSFGAIYYNGMSLNNFKQSLSKFNTSWTDNPLAMWSLIIAGLLACLIFGGLLLDMYLERKRERQKVQAVERLHKYLQSFPTSKS